MLHRAKGEKNGRMGITGRDVADSIYEASFDGCHWHFATKLKSTTIRQQVLQLFEDHCEAIFSPKDVCNKLGLGSEKDHNAMRKRLKRLADEGVTERADQGKYRWRKTAKAT